jgi:hypothetical protein
MTDARTDLEKQADQAAAAGDPKAAAALLAQAAAETNRAGVWIKLSAMRRASGDGAGALAAIDQALSLAPLDFSALLARAVLLDKAKDPRADQAFAIAVASAPEAEAIPPAYAAALEHARHRADKYQTSVEDRLRRALPADLPGSARARLGRLISNTARRTRHFHQEPTHFHFPGLPEIEFHDPASFSGLDALAAKADMIRGEFEALMAAEAAEMVPYIQYPDQVPLRQWKELNKNPKWTAIHLLQNGNPVEANARHCPRTLDLLRAVPQPRVAGASPNAIFSLLAPKTRIPPHTGVANTRLVAHLPLIVPPGCGFRVGATVREWIPGEIMVFDDTIEHEAWNDSDELRVVLIFDLWPPAIAREEREALAHILPAAGVSFTGGI